MGYRIDLRCDGCSACARQCPVDAISGVFKQAYAIDAIACIDCGVCGMVCPREAVRDERGRRTRRIPRDRRPRPVVDVDRCNGCALCVSACPFACRLVVGPRFRGIVYLAAPDLCVSCGECASSCIKAAIRMEQVEIRRFDPVAEARRLARILASDLTPIMSPDPRS